MWHELLVVLGVRKLIIEEFANDEAEVRAIRQASARRTVWAWRSTVLWVLVVATLCRVGNADNMELNEWGDFLAGVTAPLAFLWLVVGYFQQGSELRIQAHELSSSVKQQKDMAKAMQETLLIERAKLEDERLAAFEARQPAFRFSSQGWGGSESQHPNKIPLSATIKNHGATAHDVHIGSKDVLVTWKEQSHFLSGYEHPITIFIEKDCEQFSLEITYSDAREYEHTLLVDVVCENRTWQFGRPVRLHDEA